MPMRVEFDQAKRAVTLAERGLDFADAINVFEGRSITFEDERRAYGESRFITIGELPAIYVIENNAVCSMVSDKQYADTNAAELIANAVRN